MAHYRVEISAGAEQDLEQLTDHIAQNGSQLAAARLLDQLLDRIGSLESFPERGACPKELQALGIRGYRQLNIGVYRLIYRVAGNIVQILLIADGRRDMSALLQQRLLSS